MHELPITKSIIKICCEEAEKHGAKKIKEINIKVGELTGLMPSCIQYYFDIMGKNTKVEGAKLNIKKANIKIHCNQCDNESFVTKGKYTCPNCNSNFIKIIGGNEFYIESLEVE